MLRRELFKLACMAFFLGGGGIINKINTSTEGLEWNFGKLPCSLPESFKNNDMYLATF